MIKKYKITFTAEQVINVTAGSQKEARQKALKLLDGQADIWTWDIEEII